MVKGIKAEPARTKVRKVRTKVRKREKLETLPRKKLEKREQRLERKYG